VHAAADRTARGGSPDHDLAVFDFPPAGGMVLAELQPGVTLEEVRSSTRRSSRADRPPAPSAHGRNHTPSCRAGAAPAASARGAAPRRFRPLAPAHVGLAAILVLSGLLQFVRLSQNGYANTYYSAAVKSMLRSWHAFFYVSADPNGLISVDKPPLGLWVEALSAKLFGFAPLSLLIPEGICAVLAVALIYRIVAPRFGSVAGLLSAFSLAVFPSFVAVSRDSGVDPLLILLMLAACGAGLAAIDSGRLRTLVWCGVLAGLAFNTKSLAALLCVPGIGLGYLVCAPGSPRRRLAQLTAAGVVFAIVALSWITIVQLTPASQRPFVGSTSSNSEFQLALGYNGFGRVGGQQGGRGSRPFTTSRGPDCAAGPARRELARPDDGRAPIPCNAPAAGTGGAAGRQQRPPPSSASGSVRRRAQSMADLRGGAGWSGGVARAAGVDRHARARPGGARARARRPPYRGAVRARRLVPGRAGDAGLLGGDRASVLLLGARAGLAAMVGAGAVAIASLTRGRDARAALRGYLLAVAAVVGTVGVQLVVIGHEGDPLWWRIPLVVISLGALIAIPLVRRRAGGPSRSRSARCWSRRWSTALASGSRPSTGRSRQPGPTATPAREATPSVP